MTAKLTAKPQKISFFIFLLLLMIFDYPPKQHKKWKPIPIVGDFFSRFSRGKFSGRFKTKAFISVRLVFFIIHITKFNLKVNNGGWADHRSPLCKRGCFSSWQWLFNG
jgi:hypothetical protein